MDDDRSWLKNPVLPRPPAVPRFSAAELRLADEERESGVMRIAPRAKRDEPDEGSPQRVQRVSGASAGRAGFAPRRSA